MCITSFESPNTLIQSNNEFLKNLPKIINTSIDVICTIDVDGRFIWLNNASESMWGYSPIELIGQLYIDHVIPEDRELTNAVAASITSGVNYTNFENRYFHKNGSVVPIVWSATWDPDEQVMYCIGRDGTAKKLAEKELQDKNALLQKALRVANMGTWEYDVVKGQVWWSDELHEIYGIEKETAQTDLFATFLEHIYPQDLALVKKKLEINESVKYSFVHRMIRPDGKLIYLRQSTSLIEHKDGIIVKVCGIAQDVTETMTHDQELRIRERRFKSLLQSSSDLVGIIDLIGNYTYVGENVTAILGFLPEDFIGKNAFDFIHPDDAERVYSHLAAITLESFVEIKPFRFKNAKGEWRWIETRVNNLMDDPAVEGLVVNSRDVTERKQIQDKMSELSKIAEQTENAVVITDTEGSITWVNTAFEKISGYHFAEVEGKKPGAFLQGPDSNPSVINVMREAIKKREGFEVEIINYTQKGEPYLMQIQCQPHFNEAGGLCGFFAIQSNITEKKRLEHELQNEVAQRQKRITLAMLHAQEKERSELSKELHDNVNQILTTVKLYLEMAEEGKENAPSLVAKAKDYVMDSINEIRFITKRLAAPEKIEVNLNEAIQELVDSISAAGKITIEYKHYGLNQKHPAENIWLAIFRVAQEHLTNIVKHAEASKVQVSLSIIAGNLRLLVIDNGKGFDISKKRRGIGLNNMYNRIETLNGRLDIKSKEGGGCTLMAVVPLAAN